MDGSFLLIIALVIVGAAWFFVGTVNERTRWQRDLIARDLAYYDPKTREFKWKEKEPTK